MSHAVQHGSLRSSGRSVVSPSSAVDDWRGHALCRDEPPELFFPLGQSEAAARQTEAAKQVCRRCPVCRECREWALSQVRLEGVFGATDVTDRQRLRASAGRAD